MSHLLRHTIAILMVVLACGGWLLGAMDTPLLNRQLAAQHALATSVAQTGGLDLMAEQRLAEAYWQRNPDVAASGHYGRHGRTGIFGAREHWLSHGKGEGRHWGE
jgi:hypothetical protein